MKNVLKRLGIEISAAIVRAPAPKTLFYHDVGVDNTPMGTPSRIFFAHMKCLRSEDVVCFDDGFRGVWKERETFSRLGIHPKIFLAVDLVGKHGYLTWDEIVELRRDFGFVFQCHTWSHQTLAGPWNEEVERPISGRTDSWFHHELRDSKEEIERRLGADVTELCFPVGYFSDEVIRRCKDMGYLKVYASFPGNISTDYVQPRCPVQDLSPFAFRCVLNGGMNLFKRRYLRMHKIDALSVCR